MIDVVIQRRNVRRRHGWWKQCELSTFSVQP